MEDFAKSFKNSVEEHYDSEIGFNMKYDVESSYKETNY